jgi:hypothetical protein
MAANSPPMKWNLDLEKEERDIPDLWNPLKSFQTLLKLCIGLSAESQLSEFKDRYVNWEKTFDPEIEKKLDPEIEKKLYTYFTEYTDNTIDYGAFYTKCLIPLYNDIQKKIIDTLQEKFGLSIDIQKASQDKEEANFMLEGIFFHSEWIPWKKEGSDGTYMTPSGQSITTNAEYLSMIGTFQRILSTNMTTIAEELNIYSLEISMSHFFTIQDTETMHVSFFETNGESNGKSVFNKVAEELVTNRRCFYIHNKKDLIPSRVTFVKKIIKHPFNRYPDQYIIITEPLNVNLVRKKTHNLMTVFVATVGYVGTYTTTSSTKKYIYYILFQDQATDNEKVGKLPENYTQLIDKSTYLSHFYKGQHKRQGRLLMPKDFHYVVPTLTETVPNSVSTIENYFKLSIASFDLVNTLPVNTLPVNTLPVNIASTYDDLFTVDIVEKLPDGIRKDLGEVEKRVIKLYWDSVINPQLKAKKGLNNPATHFSQNNKLLRLEKFRIELDKKRIRYNKLSTVIDYATVVSKYCYDTFYKALKRRMGAEKRQRELTTETNEQEEYWDSWADCLIQTIFLKVCYGWYLLQHFTCESVRYGNLLGYYNNTTDESSRKFHNDYATMLTGIDNYKGSFFHVPASLNVYKIWEKDYSIVYFRFIQYPYTKEWKCTDNSDAFKKKITDLFTNAGEVIYKDDLVQKDGPFWECLADVLSYPTVERNYTYWCAMYFFCHYVIGMVNETKIQEKTTINLAMQFVERLAKIEPSSSGLARMEPSSTGLTEMELNSSGLLETVPPSTEDDSLVNKLVLMYI